MNWRFYYGHKHKSWEKPRRRDSDVGLYVRVAGQDVSVEAALGLPCWRGAGQHVGGRGRLFRRRLAPLEPAVYQGHKEQHHAPNHRRDPRQGERNCVVAKEIPKNTCGVRGGRVCVFSVLFILNVASSTLLCECL